MPCEVLTFLHDKEEKQGIEWEYLGLVLDAPSEDCQDMRWEALERGKLTIHVQWTGEERPDAGATFLDPSRLGLKEEAKRIPRQIARRTNGVETSLAEEQERGEEPENFVVFPMEDGGVFLRKVVEPALLEQLHAGCASMTTRHLKQ